MLVLGSGDRFHLQKVEMGLIEQAAGDEGQAVQLKPPSEDHGFGWVGFDTPALLVGSEVGETLVLAQGRQLVLVGEPREGRLLERLEVLLD